MISTQDIKNKEIINIHDGKSLGYVTDIEINLEKGRVEAIIVPVQSGFFSFFSKENEYIIRWKDIKKIGEDVILVDVKNIFNSDENEGNNYDNEMDMD
ncbi:MAG: YlmC/YmxH family sporulation protein [Clostridiales bacterium]|nr:YlmC/YmxH family sporulation protein [Clostridiales bacterium]